MIGQLNIKQRLLKNPPTKNANATHSPLCHPPPESKHCRAFSAVQSHTATDPKVETMSALYSIPFLVIARKRQKPYAARKPKAIKPKRGLLIATSQVPLMIRITRSIRYIISEVQLIVQEARLYHHFRNFSQSLEKSFISARHNDPIFKLIYGRQSFLIDGARAGSAAGGG